MVLFFFQYKKLVALKAFKKVATKHTLHIKKSDNLNILIFDLYALVYKHLKQNVFIVSILTTYNVKMVNIESEFLNFWSILKYWTLETLIKLELFSHPISVYKTNHKRNIESQLLMAFIQETTNGIEIFWNIKLLIPYPCINQLLMALKYFESQLLMAFIKETIKQFIKETTICMAGQKFAWLENNSTGWTKIHLAGKWIEYNIAYRLYKHTILPLFIQQIISLQERMEMQNERNIDDDLQVGK